MIRRLLGVFLVLICVPTQAQTLPTVSSGKIERWQSFTSRFVEARNVDVWLPNAYSEKKRYAVIYMHDGQMLFDASTTWNKQEWQVDETLGRLIREKKIPDTIVVAIWNNGDYRHSEYYPQKYLETLNPKLRKQYIELALKNKPQSDNYLRFIVQELKPAIDKKYATLSEREHTFILGSSMGGLISIYAMNEYPEVFGGAAGLSTHWIGSHETNYALPLAAFNYLDKNLADPSTHRLYMDHGTVNLDSKYTLYQQFINNIMRDKGYNESNWRSEVFEGADHNETDWAKRLHVAIEFLLSKP